MPQRFADCFLPIVGPLGQRGDRTYTRDLAAGRIGVSEQLEKISLLGAHRHHRQIAICVPLRRSPHLRNDAVKHHPAVQQPHMLRDNLPQVFGKIDKAGNGRPLDSSAPQDRFERRYRG